MPKVLTLPKIGVSMTEATIVNWLVREGDFVEVDQPVLEAETEKATQEIPSTVSGVLAKILVRPGETVQCQEPIAVLVERGEVLPRDFSPVSQGGAAREGAGEPVKAGFTTTGSSPAAKAGGGGAAQRVKISPLAKKLAQELRVDYTQVAPSKPGGRIEREDILAFAGRAGALAEETPRAAPAPGDEGEEIVPLRGLRGIIARKMLESARATARAALTASVDASRLVGLREKLNGGGGKVTYNDLLVAVTARALRAFPLLNSRIEGEGIRVLKRINIGVAVDTEHGLTVPVIHDADTKDIQAISAESSLKLERARRRKSTAEDISGGTFTITNLGMHGVESFVPIINPPEAAILAVGAIERRPVVSPESGTVVIRPMCTLTLVFDHRIVDGAPAARFLKLLKDRIENPEPHVSGESREETIP